MFAGALGIVTAIVLFVIVRLINQHCCRPTKKTANDPSLPFQAPRRPTAVRSPSGQPTHYLKKSPSPNGSKPLPGHVGGSALLTPTGPQCESPAGTPGGSHPANSLFAANITAAAATTTTVKYTEENEQTNINHHARSGGNTSVNSIAKYQHHNPQHPHMMDASIVDASSGGGGGGGAPDAAIDPANDYGKLGSLVFKLHYLTERNALVVSVVRCRGLPGKQMAQQQQMATMIASDGITITTTTASTSALGNGIQNGAGHKSSGSTTAGNDPYVKLQLLPEKQHKVKTRVVRNTRNPVYDEDFTFYGLSLAELSLMSLHFVVLSFDRYSRDDVIGEVVCPLSGIDLSQIENQQVALSKEIQPRSLKIRAQGRGELLTSLCWQPATSRLTVVLLKARNLPRMDVTGLADPYVKIYLMFNGQRIARKKTHVKKRTLSPVFNESFAFDIPTVEVSILRLENKSRKSKTSTGSFASQGTGASLEGVSLELMLLDWDRVTKNEVRR